jgi:predicted lipase
MAFKVTGHSLGAAMASLCAGYIAAMGYIPGDKIKLVTYGQPRTGDLAYANYIDNTVLDVLNEDEIFRSRLFTE